MRCVCVCVCGGGTKALEVFKTSSTSFKTKCFRLTIKTQDNITDVSYHGQLDVLEKTKMPLYLH